MFHVHPGLARMYLPWVPVVHFTCYTQGVFEACPQQRLVVFTVLNGKQLDIFIPLEMINRWIPSLKQLRHNLKFPSSYFKFTNHKLSINQTQPT